MDKVNIKHSNYTTPEQSLRLIELGVPANSSDCYYTSSGKIEIKNTALDTLYPSCWSVGELMRIYAICFDPDFIHFDTFADGTNFLKQMMDKFETYVENMNFSKLEE